MSSEPSKASYPMEKTTKLRRKMASAEYPIINQFECEGSSALRGPDKEIRRTQGSTKVPTVKLIKWSTKPAMNEAVTARLIFSVCVGSLGLTARHTSRCLKAMRM